MKITFINTLMVVALMMGGRHLYAQELSMEYTAEWQTTLRYSNFVNLLRLNAEVPMSKYVTLEASTISIAKTREDRLINDLQTFSNIEEDNLPLAIAVCGAHWDINRRHSLFMGIRNVNEDYFTSPAAAFFTNSSCGIFPTISANHPIANYPLASAGLHYCYHGKPLRVQASLYNGTGHNRFSRRDNLLRICPKGDGVLAIAEAAYTHGDSHYFLGNAINWKGRTNVSTPFGRTLTPWFYAEQRVSPRLTLLAGYSHAFTSEPECKDFAGMGVHYQVWQCQAGIFTDYASFSEGDEIATEFTCRLPITQHIDLQPAWHIISCHGKVKCVGMVRIVVGIISVP